MIVTVGLGLEPNGGVAWAIIADGLIKIEPSAHEDSDAIVSMAKAVGPLCSSDTSVTLAVACVEENQVADDIVNAAVQELGWMGIAVEHVNLMRIASISGTIRKECTGAVPSRAPLGDILLSFARRRGVVGYLTPAQAVAVAVTRPPVAVWGGGTMIARTGRSHARRGRTDHDIPRAQELLTVDDLAHRFGIARSSAYRLARHIPSYRIPGVGLRFRFADVEAFEEAYRRNPAPTTKCARRRPAGMRIAVMDDDEVVIDGMTRRELKEKAGF